MNAKLRILALILATISTINAKPNTCTAQPQSSVAHCLLHKLGRVSAAAYCTSILSISSSTVPTTSTFTITKTADSTEILTQTQTLVNRTTTSYIDTSTVTSTSFEIVYTCGTVNTTKPTSVSSVSSSSNNNATGTRHHPSRGSTSIVVTASHPSASLSISSSPGSNLSVTAHRPPPLTSYATSCSYESNEKRQTQTFSSPYCLKRFFKKYGDDAITDACECLHTKTAAPLTSTVIVTELTTIVISDKSTTTKTVNTITAVNATSIGTLTVTSRITTASPTPSQFFIYYVDHSSNSTNSTAHFFSAGTSPGDSGIVLAPEVAADSFSLDSFNRLVDTTDGNRFIAKNTDDLYPFELLRTKATTNNTPVCSACDGALQCDYPGTTENTFALCYGYLALGPKTVFGKDSDANGDVDCIPIKLQFK